MLCICSCFAFQKVNRRKSAHEWVLTQPVEEGVDYTKFGALLVAPAMSSDDTDDYEDGKGHKVRGLKRSVVKWRSADAIAYINFLDKVYDRQSGKLQVQMSKPLRLGVRESTSNHKVNQLLLQHPEIKQFIASAHESSSTKLPALPAIHAVQVFEGPRNESSPLHPMFASKATKSFKVVTQERSVEPFEQHLVGLRRTPNAGGGDCLYLSLLDVHSCKYKSVADLRQLFVTKALENADMHVLGGEEAIRQHLQLGHWDDNVGDAVLELLLKALNLNAIIIHSDGRIPYHLTLFSQPTDSVTLLRFPGHWEGLKPCELAEPVAQSAPLPSQLKRLQPSGEREEPSSAKELKVSHGLCGVHATLLGKR